MSFPLEEIKRRLIHAGASPEAVENIAPEFFEDVTEDADFESLAIVVNFLDFLENFENYKRKRVTITLAEPMYKVLRHIANRILDADGRPYPVSYLMEDMMAWILRDPDRFSRFIEETYQEEDSDGGDSEVEFDPPNEE